MIARLALATAVVAVVLGVSAAPASAHSGSGSVGASNYLTEISDVVPATGDVTVRVLDLGDRLELTSRSDDDVIVLGYEDEPYLKISADGVFENTRSSATYVNADRQASADIPEDVDADAEPEWRKVSDGRTVRWHDHRAHWMGSDDPPAVAAEPDRAHVVFDRWEVPLTIDGAKVLVTGTLTWSPGPSMGLWLAAAAALTALAMGAFLVLRRHRVLVLAAAVVIVVLVGIAQTIGLAFAPNQGGPAVVRFFATAMYPAIGWVFGFLGVLYVRLNRPDAVYVAAMAGAVAVLVGGAQDLGSLAKAHTPFLGGELLARSAVAASLGIGVAVLLMCFALRPRPSARPAAR